MANNPDFKSRDEIFFLFINDLKKITNNDIDFDKTQKKMFNEMFKAELKVRDLLLKHKEETNKINAQLIKKKRPVKYSPEEVDIYVKFMRFVKEELGNLLTVRLYFRERGSTFGFNISKAFDKMNPKLFYKYHPNYYFVRWVVENYKGPQEEKIKQQLDIIEKNRTELCENSILLAINRAKIFWAKFEGSHLAYSDLIQDSCEGLIVAIDKFVPPYRNVWRSVAIGRMKLNMTSSQQNMMVKFSPSEKRVLYRANNAVNKEKLESTDDILQYVQESFPWVTKDKLESLLTAATSVESLDPSPEEDTVGIHQLPAVGDPAQHSEKDDLVGKLLTYVKKLTIIEQKVVKMKSGLDTGVESDNSNG